MGFERSVMLFMMNSRDCGKFMKRSRADIPGQPEKVKADIAVGFFNGDDEFELKIDRTFEFRLEIETRLRFERAEFSVGGDHGTEAGGY